MHAAVARTKRRFAVSARFITTVELPQQQAACISAQSPQLLVELIYSFISPSYMAAQNKGINVENGN